MVWKPREGLNQSFVQYWMELIKHRIYDEERPDQRPRVLVVATHGSPKQRQPHIDEQQLRNQFGNMIIGFHQVDNKTGEGIPELKAMIAEVAAEIPRQRDPYISYEEFEALCAD